MNEVSPRTRGARRCTNPESEFGNRWVVDKMVRTKNGKLMCVGKGCHSIYQPQDVIDPANEDWQLWVGYP